MQTDNIRATNQPFDKQLNRVYTWAVYKKYRKDHFASTAFRIDADSDSEDTYLVTRTNDSKTYAWLQHSFRVYANAQLGKYTCECRTWEHTGKNGKLVNYNFYV